MLDRLVDFIIQILGAFKPLMVIHPWQMGVRLRLGKFRSVLSPGLHWLVPFYVDTVIAENVVTETMRVRPQSLTTKDGKLIVVSSVVTFRIEDVKTFLLDVEGRNNVIEDSTYGATAAFIMKRTWEELSSMEDVGNELSKIVRRQAKRYGVDVISVQLMDFALCRPLRLITSAQIKEFYQHVQ